MLSHFEVGLSVHHLSGGCDGRHACHVKHCIPIVIQLLDIGTALFNVLLELVV